LPSLATLLDVVADHLPQHEVVKVNASTGTPEYGPTFNFLVGGNILGRGVTIDDLLVTYYLRQAQVSQMDTVWQHGRMFGYRDALMPFTRVFLPRRLAQMFKGIHAAEEDLRVVLQTLEPGQPVPITVVPGTRPTRPNALESDVVHVYQAGVQIFPQFVQADPAAVGSSADDVTDLLRALDVPLDEPTIRGRFREVDIDAMIRLAELVPVRADDDGRWNTGAVVAVLEALRPAYGDRGAVYVRRFADEIDAARAGERFRTGVLSGQGEVAAAKTLRRPVLALVYSGPAGAPRFWYPTLFLPEDSPTKVFAVSA
jgi:hypothetical protein